MLRRKSSLFCVLYACGLVVLMLSMSVSAQVAPETDLSINIRSLSVRVGDDDRAYLTLRVGMRNDGPDDMESNQFVAIDYPYSISAQFNIPPQPCGFETDLDTNLSTSAFFPALEAGEEYQCDFLIIVNQFLQVEDFFVVDIHLSDLASHDPDLSNNRVQRRVWIRAYPIPIPSLSHANLFLLMILVLATAGYVTKAAFGIRKDKVL